MARETPTLDPMRTIERTVLDLCDEVDDLRERLEFVTRERDEWREKYINQTIADIKHGEAMMAGLLAVAIDRVKPPADIASD